MINRSTDDIFCWRNVLQLSEITQSKTIRPFITASLPTQSVTSLSAILTCPEIQSTTREEHILRVYENKVWRKILGPKREEDGLWRKLHKDELHSLYSSPDAVRVITSRRMRWVGHAEHMGEGRGVYSVLVGRCEGKRPLGRPRCRWKDNIKIDCREIGSME
jgi:hypothetical protein